MAFLRVREDGRTVVRVQVPFVQTNVGGVGGYGLSDVSVKVTNAFKVTPQYVPSQYGLFDEGPQRQSTTLASSRGAPRASSAKSPVTMYGPLGRTSRVVAITVIVASHDPTSRFTSSKDQNGKPTTSPCSAQSHAADGRFGRQASINGCYGAQCATTTAGRGCVKLDFGTFSGVPKPLPTTNKTNTARSMRLSLPTSHFARSFYTASAASGRIS